MQYIKIIIVCSILFGAPVCSQETTHKTFAEWYTICKGLESVSLYSQPRVTLSELDDALTQVKNVNYSFLRKSLVVKRLADDLIQKTIEKDSFTPFAQKLIVPHGSTVYFWGDLHGDAAFLARALKHIQESGVIDDDFKIIKDTVYFVFLGDFVDRGRCGIEVLYTLARLKLANPEHVFLVRGNHETLQQNNSGGFKDELEYRFMVLGQNNKDDLDQIEKKINEFLNITLPIFYNTLPVVIYLGVGKDTKEFIQCCHGGMEIGFNPQALFERQCKETESVVLPISNLMRKELFSSLCPNPTLGKSFFANCFEFFQIDKKTEVTNFFMKSSFPISTKTALGFMWSDFSVIPFPFTTVMSNRGDDVISYGSELTDAIITSYAPYTVLAIIRGHQHNQSMPELIDEKSMGMFSLPWNQPVYTTIATTVIPLAEYDGMLELNKAAAYLQVDFFGAAVEWDIFVNSYRTDTLMWHISSHKFLPAKQNKNNPLWKESI